MKSFFNRKELAEHLYRVVTSERFLRKQGLGNEVPFFICPFPAEFAVGVEDDRRDLVTRAEHAGVKVLDLSLYSLAIEMALLHKSLEGRGSPLPGRIYPTGSVTGMPRAV